MNSIRLSNDSWSLKQPSLTTEAFYLVLNETVFIYLAVAGVGLGIVFSAIFFRRKLKIEAVSFSFPLQLEKILNKLDFVN